MDDAKERLLEYYKGLSENNTAQTDRILERAVASLSHEYAYSISSEIENVLVEITNVEKMRERQEKRIAAYAEGLAAIYRKNKKLQKYREIVEVLEEAYEDYDFDAEVELELNGNKFSFGKDIDIEPYKDTLTKIGDNTKGNAWRVEIEDGKVVLSE